ncbi:sigma-70 family RNA polymerase sigma factor [Bacillus cytotoxicus]|uniref:Sigma-70 family RNA polymerase sigma factor n=1 Tax=Bacillus cytotoxicus TaxID=580165 RepID=A0ACC6A6E1_9BACI|nr:sigma-70 family RNA polymerase sigma factor [Bacillus cytotoxicus]
MQKETIDVIEDVQAMSDEEFLEKYEKLVHHFIWKKYGKKLESIKNDTGFDPEDLTQLGMIGLIKARQTFDYKLGYQFSTYASYKVYGEIGRGIRDCQKVKVPRTIYNLKGKIMMNGLHENDSKEISAQLDASIEDVEVALQYQPGTLSLNKAMNDSDEDKDITFEKTLVDKSTERIDEEVENGIVLDSFMKTLEHKEFFVWDMHSKNRPQQEISKQTGVSQPHISRILKSINKKAADFGRRKELSS